MSVGIFGNKVLSNVTAADVDVLYSYAPDSETLPGLTMQPLFPTLTNSDLVSLLGADGVYNLRLPASKFNQLGFYLVLIKPKTIQLQISDCSYVITNNASQAVISKRGIVIPAAQVSSIGNLVGYTVQYYDTNNVKINNLSRVVTSSDLVSISTNNNNIAQGSTGYVLDPAGSSYFLTLSPDESSTISNIPINLGSKGQLIDISNSYFDPVFIEVQMVNFTMKEMSYILAGNSTRNNQTGVLSVFDDKNNIYRQYNLYDSKLQFSNGTISVKEERAITNLNSDFLSVSQGLST